MQRFGISTHLFHNDRLSRDHLLQIAGHGFDAVELFAVRSHFDYTRDQGIAELAEWLSQTGLTLHSVHAPIVERLDRGRWIGPYSNASTDERRRAVAVGEAEAALAMAARVPFRYLVVHLGLPTGEDVRDDDNDPDAARRSIEDIVAAASRVDVGVALEVIPNALSEPEALVSFIEHDLDGLDVGVCLDYGHAHLMGDVSDAVEALSGHLWTTHVHDNRGQEDEHLTPYAGTIDWDAAMMETQKVGYDGLLMFELADGGDPIEVLRRSAKARTRLADTLVSL
jgi:sugar phosphate isomerase/epimerase